MKEHMLRRGKTGLSPAGATVGGAHSREKTAISADSMSRAREPRRRIGGAEYRRAGSDNVPADRAAGTMKDSKGTSSLT